VTRYPPLWVQQAQFPATADRRLISALWPDARASGLEVSPRGGGMVLNIGPGSASVPAANDTGSVLCASDALEELELAPPGPSGVHRYDLVVVEPQSDDLGNGTGDVFAFVAVVGVSSGSPVPPAVPIGTTPLAQVYVQGGSQTIAANNITDLRPGALFVPRDLGLPPPVTTGATTQSFVDHTGEMWVARTGVNGGQWRRARDVLHLEARRVPVNDDFVTVGGQDANMVLNNTVRDPYGMWNSNIGIVPVAGLYDIKAQLGFYNVAANQWLNLSIGPGQGNPTARRYAPQVSPPLNANFPFCTLIETTAFIPAGGQVTLTYATQTAWRGRNDLCFLTLHYVGSG
jgi:hypothetical protein